MKHITRKPMLPLLLLAIMVFGTGFLAFFRADIAAGWDQVEHIYSDTRVTVEIVPDSGWGNLQMKTHKSMIIGGMPEIAEILSVMECYYVLRDENPFPEPSTDSADPLSSALTESDHISAETATIRGTNNLPWLTEYWNLSVEWCDGWGLDSFCVMENTVPCLVRQDFLDLNNLKPGDIIEISPSAWSMQVSPQAPRIALTIAGTYDEEIGRIGPSDLLVPEESFMNAPKLLYNADMMYRCYYRAYAMRLNPEYNRDYYRIEEELEGILYDLSGYSFVTNARALEKAARPLIQKLQMQELLVLPLSLLLCAAAVVVAVLLGMSMDTEIFLRLMWGEKRLTVFACLGSLICLWLGVCVAAACAASCITAGTQWVIWAARYSGATATLCAVGCGIPLIRRCCSNLVKSYQSREGE